jgi:spore coat polysaccharide biosynthesis protein SpsF
MATSLKVCVTIEARMAATRLPGKVLLPLAGAPMLQRLVERVRRSTRVDEVVVASTTARPDRAIADLCDRIGCRVHCGPVEDISLRILEAAGSAGVIVQVTGDCPLIDPEHIDRTVALLQESHSDYASNALTERSFPLGLEVRAFTRAALERTIALTNDPIDRVHGSYFIYSNPALFRLAGWQASAEMRWPDLRLTVDEPEDYELVRRVFETLHPERPHFTGRDVVTLLRQRPDWVELNSSVRQKTAAEG